MKKFAQRLELKTKNALQVYWDDTLTPSETNPFPLAPPDEVRAKRVDPIRYKRQNTRLKYRSKKVMVPETAKLSQSQSFKEGRRTIVRLGWGLGRDAEEQVLADVEAGFLVDVIDSSSVACHNCRAFVKKHGLKASVRVRQIELEAAWEREVIKEDQVIAYVASQFIQNQGLEAMGRMMEHFGAFIRGSGCAVYLFHPPGEDNPPEKVEWRNTIPFLTKHLRLYADKGFGGPIKMEVIGRHRYYHQRYVFLKLSAPEEDGAT